MSGSLTDSQIVKGLSGLLKTQIVVRFKTVQLLDPAYETCSIEVISTMAVVGDDSEWFVHVQQGYEVGKTLAYGRPVPSVHIYRIGGAQDDWLKRIVDNWEIQPDSRFSFLDWKGPWMQPSPFVGLMTASGETVQIPSDSSHLMLYLGLLSGDLDRYAEKLAEYSTSTVEPRAAFRTLQARFGAFVAQNRHSLARRTILG